MRKVLELNEKPEILSPYSDILLSLPHFPAFHSCFGCCLTEYAPHLFYLWNTVLIVSTVSNSLTTSLRSMHLVLEF